MMKHFALILLLCAPMLAQTKSRPLRAVVCMGGGTATAATCSPSPGLAALSDLSTTPRTIVLFTPAANNTGALTLAISGLAATAIKKPVGGAAQDPAADDLRAGISYSLEYDGTNFIIKNLLGNGGSGGGGGFYSQTWFFGRDYAGNRFGNLSTAGNGADGLNVVDNGATTASSVQAIHVSSTAGEKVGLTFRLPLTPTTWNIIIHGYSRSISALNFSVTRQCLATGDSIATPNNAATGTVTPSSASNQYYEVSVSMVTTGCTSGKLARVVISTTSTIDTWVNAVSTYMQ